MFHKADRPLGNHPINGRTFFVFVYMLGLLLSLLFVHVSQVKADTEVGGPITSNTTWTLAGSPYIVTTESVTVNQGVKLTIEPGVSVRFNSGLKLWVNGTLIARGTEGNPITFTSNQVDPNPGDWGNIDFSGSTVNTIVDPGGNYISGSILQHCVIEYGGQYGIYYQNAVYVEYNSMIVDNCRIEHNHGSGIVILGNPGFPSWVTNNTLRDNRAWGLGGGVLLRDGVMINNLIVDNQADGGSNGGGIYAANADIINNTIRNNTTTQDLGTQGGGIFVEAIRPGNILIQGNIIQDNGVVDLGGGISINADNPDAEFIVKHNLISRNNAFSDGGGIYVSGVSGNVTILDNTISGNIADSDEDTIGSGGGVYCEYIEGMHVLKDNVIIDNSAGDSGGGIFTDYCDISRNMIFNNNAVKSGGGIVSSGDIISNTISSNSLSAANAMGTGVMLHGSGNFLNNSLVTNSGNPGSLMGGLQIIETPQVHNNNLFGNVPYNVVVDTLPAYQISGTSNYWGTDDADEIQEGIYDNIDKGSRGEFIFDPFLPEAQFFVPLTPPSGLKATLLNEEIRLEWDIDPNFATGWGYKVYYDDDTFLPPYEGLGLGGENSPIDVGDQTQILLSGLEPYTDYYFAATLYDDLGRESSYAVVVIDQPDEPVPVIPTGLTAALTGDQVELQWNMVPDFSDGWYFEVNYDVDSYWPPFEGVGLIEGDSPIYVGDQTTVVLSGLQPFIDYYFAIRVFNDLGNPSGYAIAIVEQTEPNSSSIYLPLIKR